MSDTAVLVVGAGPTGMALAIELGRRQVPFRLIDRARARSPESRALVVQARTLELMRPWGVAEALVTRGRPTVQAQFFVERQAAAQVELGDIGVDDTPYPFILFVSQAETEQALDDALARLGGRIERGVELVGGREDDDGVTAELRHADGRTERVRAGWLVGCDGAHSAVRHLAELEFAGAAYEQSFLLADLEIAWDAPTQLYVFLGQGKNAVVIPLRDGLWRIIATGGAPGAGDEPPLEEIAGHLGEVCPFSFSLARPRWRARFRLHHRGVSRYRAGRLLVAGDAAHIHSPVGGQGMNTGIQDAVNLGWKLALVARGEAPAALLDSYDEERRPVGRRLLQVTDRLFSVVSSSNPLVVWLRNRVVPLAAPRMLATPARRKLVFRFISELAIHYRGTSLCGAAGERAPDAVVDGGHLLDRFAAPCHHLVVFGRRGGELARAATARFGPHLDATVVEDATARRRYRVDGDGWVLVRPDGYVGARGHGFDAADALDAYFGARIGISASKRSM